MKAPSSRKTAESIATALSPGRSADELRAAATALLNLASAHNESKKVTEFLDELVIAPELEPWVDPATPLAAAFGGLELRAYVVNALGHHQTPADAKHMYVQLLHACSRHVFRSSDARIYDDRSLAVSCSIDAEGQMSCFLTPLVVKLEAPSHVKLVNEENFHEDLKGATRHGSASDENVGSGSAVNDENDVAGTVPMNGNVNDTAPNPVNGSDAFVKETETLVAVKRFLPPAQHVTVRSTMWGYQVTLPVFILKRFEDNTRPNVLAMRRLATILMYTLTNVPDSLLPFPGASSLLGIRTLVGHIAAYVGRNWDHVLSHVSPAAPGESDVLGVILEATWIVPSAIDSRPWVSHPGGLPIPVVTSTSPMVSSMQMITPHVSTRQRSPYGSLQDITRQVFSGIKVGSFRASKKDEPSFDRTTDESFGHAPSGEPMPRLQKIRGRAAQLVHGSVIAPLSVGAPASTPPVISATVPVENAAVLPVAVPPPRDEQMLSSIPGPRDALGMMEQTPQHDVVPPAPVSKRPAVPRPVPSPIQSQEGQQSSSPRTASPADRRDRLASSGASNRVIDAPTLPVIDTALKPLTFSGSDWRMHSPRSSSTPAAHEQFQKHENVSVPEWGGPRKLPSPVRLQQRDSRYHSAIDAYPMQDSPQVRPLPLTPAFNTHDPFPMGRIPNAALKTHETHDPFQFRGTFTPVPGVSPMRAESQIPPGGRSTPSVASGSEKIGTDAPPSPEKESVTSGQDIAQEGSGPTAAAELDLVTSTKRASPTDAWSSEFIEDRKETEREPQLMDETPVSERKLLPSPVVPLSVASAPPSQSSQGEEQRMSLDVNPQDTSESLIDEIQAMEDSIEDALPVRNPFVHLGALSFPQAPTESEGSFAGLELSRREDRPVMVSINTHGLAEPSEAASVRRTDDADAGDVEAGPADTEEVGGSQDRTAVSTDEQLPVRAPGQLPIDLFDTTPTYVPQPMPVPDHSQLLVDVFDTVPAQKVDLTSGGAEGPLEAKMPGSAPDVVQGVVPSSLDFSDDRPETAPMDKSGGPETVHTHPGPLGELPEPRFSSTLATTPGFERQLSDIEHFVAAQARGGRRRLETRVSVPKDSFVGEAASGKDTAEETAKAEESSLATYLQGIEMQARSLFKTKPLFPFQKPTNP